MVAPPGCDSPPVRPVWIVGVLGHRRLDDPATLGPRIEEQLRGLAMAVAARGGETHVYVSAAAGTDLLAIRAARSLGLPVHILLPLDEAEFLEDFAEFQAWRDEARAALAEARAHPRRDSVQVAPTTGQRPSCYFDTDARIVEGADVIVAVWNGTAAIGLGGTGQTVPLAQALGKPMLRIDPATAQVERSGFGPGEWPPPDEKWEWLQVSAAVAQLPPGVRKTEAASLQNLKARLSAIAQQDSSDFRRKALRALHVTATAGILGLVNLLLTGRVHWTIPLTITVAQSVLLVWTKVIKSHLKRSKINDDWIQARLGAEVWRGVVATYPAAGGMHPIAGRRLPEWRRFAVSVGIASQRLDRPLDLSLPVDLEEFKSGYVERLKAQIAHFEQQRDRSKQRTHRLLTVAHFCFVLSPWSVGLAILIRAAGKVTILSSPGAMSSLGILVFTAVLPAALPLGAATATALVENFDHDRRANRYDEMLTLLRRRLAELPHLHTADSVCAFVERCEDSLLQESIEWVAAQKHIAILSLGR